MPSQPKKRKSTNNTTVKKSTSKKSTSKKTAHKKSTYKKRTTAKSKKVSSWKKNILIVLGVFSSISFVAFGYFLGNEERSNSMARTKSQNAYHTQDLLNDLSQIKKKKHQSTPKKVVKKKHIISPVLIKKKKVKHVEKVMHKKPKLVIIIDDVHTRAQIEGIKSLGLKITPSIFPPYKISPKSHLLARGLEHYMIHLPMESSSKQFNKQYKTLMVNMDKADIVARVKELRRLFPKAKYVNNHTGSVFTNNYNAMFILYEALRAEGFSFVDSRTIGSSKVPKIASKWHDKYISRDIFIDNEHTISYIHKQLNKAVALAKKRGYAIAIGHPHKETMQALGSAENIFNGVSLVYIDEL